MTPGYYRPTIGGYLISVVVSLALAVALYFGGRAIVRAIQSAERTAVTREGDALLRQTLAHSAQLRRERDSLAAVAARVDTVLVRRLRVVHDTTWLPADTSPVVRLAACFAQLDSLATDCTTFRETATAALEVARQQHTADSTRVAIQSQQLAAIQRSRDAAQDQLSGRRTWRAFERGVCAASLATNYLQWRAR